MHSIAILQSSYIPWKGYFDIIQSVDEFILYDDTQFTKRDWRNRNKIKTAQGTKWLTIPVISKSKYTQNIEDVLIADSSWARAHWQVIKHSYAKAPYFSENEALFASLFEQAGEQEFLSAVNKLFLDELCQLLGISTPIVNTTDYSRSELKKTDRLIEICQQANAQRYLSGPAAKCYIDKELFEQANIELDFMDYQNYPIYPQLYGDFEESVSIIDLIFNLGADALKYIKREKSTQPEIVEE